MCTRDFEEESLKLRQVEDLEKKIAVLNCQLKHQIGTAEYKRGSEQLRKLAEQYKNLTGRHYRAC